MAADVAAMAPGTTIGAAHPIMVSAGTIMPVDPIVLDKVTNDAAGYLRGLAAQRGRNAEWAESAVRESAVLGAADALRERVVDLLAVSTDDLLSQLDGRRVVGPWGTRALQTQGAPIVDIGQTLAEMVVEIVGQPAVAYLLCLLGLVMIGLEILTPVAGAFGIAGSICVIAGLVGFDSLPVRWAGVALLALGVSLVLAELKAGGHGALAAGGVVAVAVGSWWLFPDSGPSVGGTMLRPPVWILGSAVGLLAAVSGLVIVTGSAAALRRVVPIMPGSDEVGTTETDLAPVGTVHLRGESWSGRAIAGTIPRGTAVRVAGRDGLTILVAPADGARHDASRAPDASGIRRED
jgi:membrane-bound serine protease (ClpP class)